MNQYSMLVQWSEEDQLFLVTIPEFIGYVVMSCTHGVRRKETIRNGEKVIEMCWEDWTAENELISEPLKLQIT
jgi:predicted RNase H-like HicB family nuclease